MPKRLFGQIESAVERAYYEMRAKDGSEAARKVLEKLGPSPALDGDDGKEVRK